jgi:hypothetical protein
MLALSVALVGELASSLRTTSIAAVEWRAPALSTCLQSAAVLVQAHNRLVQAEHVHLLACVLLLQKFNSWIDACIEASPVPGICLFPEGHRSRLPHSLPLKRGMLNYAYSRKMPVQVCCSRNIREPGSQWQEYCWPWRVYLVPCMHSRLGLIGTNR